jgi:hypothetical protein
MYNSPYFVSHNTKKIIKIKIILQKMYVLVRDRIFATNDYPKNLKSFQKSWVLCSPNITSHSHSSFLKLCEWFVIFELHNITTSSNGNLTYKKFVSLDKLWNFCVQKIFIWVHFVFRLTEFWPSQTWILKFELLIFCCMKKWLNPTS